MHALIVSRENHIIAQEYGFGYGPSTAHPLYSGTKSFWGVAAVIAKSNGILDLDERVADTFPAWEEDAWKRRVTLRNLLQLTSGIGFGGLGRAVPTYEKALSVELRDEPGTKFTYGGIPLQVFGAVLASKLSPQGITPHQFLQKRLLDKSDVHVEKWRALEDGSHPLPTGAFVAASEWRKYGQYLCEHHQAFRECFVGSSANPRYGLGFWLAARNAPADLFYASGAGGQGLYVVPSSQVVIVHLGSARNFRHETFLSRFFAEDSSITISE